MSERARTVGTEAALGMCAIKQTDVRGFCFIWKRQSAEGFSITSVYV